MMETVSRKNNFVYLTISLVVLLLVSTLADQFPSRLGHHLVQAFSVITIAVGIIGINSTHAWYRTGIGFLVAVVLAAALSMWFEHANLDYLHLVVLACFYSWATWLAARQVLFTGPIDGNKVVGAICIYLLTGVVWALSYLFIAQAIPNAFNGIEQMPWYNNFGIATYYSFVTLTTLGYGDISPVAPIARFLVFMEAIFGVFYMAILVASLIGIRTSKKHPEKQS